MNKKKAIELAFNGYKWIVDQNKPHTNIIHHITSYGKMEL